MAEGRQPRPPALFAVSAAMAVFAVYAGLRTRGLTTHYREMFDSFGTEISPLTKFVLDAPNLWWVIGVVVFGAAVYGFVAYALYSPIFKLGNAI